jgi:ribonuclease HI
VSASKAALLRFMAQHETFERTLAEFPDVSKSELERLLEGIAQAIEPAKPVSKPASPSQAPLSDVRPERVRIYSDGAARGNPGPAGAGAVVTDTHGVTLARLGKFLGRQTNNHAEYMGLIIGLEAARERGAREVEIFADSQLLIRQLEGRYKMKSETLRPLFLEAQQLLKSFSRVKLMHIPREENGAADEMSNRAIDERM